MLNIKKSLSLALPAALGIFAASVGGIANASVIYEYSGTTAVVFEKLPDGTAVQVPQLEGTVITGFAELADQDFQAGANLVLADLVSWGFSWTVNNADYNIDLSFDNTDFINIGAGAFNLGSGFEVVEWFWNGQDSSGSDLCIGCLGPGNTTHTMQDSIYRIKGFDGAWTLTAVPLPAALPLLASGLAGFFFAGRRRRGKHST